TPFRNRLSIWWISPLLLAADWVYFTALANPEAMVSVVSTLRRCSVIVVLALGAKRLGEVNLRRKTACVLGLLSGVVLVLLG
ncbi:MAG: permease, partial [Planctomycetota bacterium]